MKTVKVRIAVGVDHSGYWNASGWKGADPQTAMDLVLEGCSEGENRYWVIAELEIPEAQDATVVTGKVERANGTES